LSHNLYEALIQLKDKKKKKLKLIDTYNFNRVIIKFLKGFEEIDFQVYLIIMIILLFYIFINLLLSLDGKHLKLV
jgi:hypothetical protein